LIYDLRKTSRVFDQKNLPLQSMGIICEKARAHGFPDTLTWEYGTQTPKDMYKQISNAADIPAGRALGRELLKVPIKKYKTGIASKEPYNILGN
jgi:site-specific DNA-cytosine methylase